MMANLAMPVFDNVQTMVSAIQSGRCQAAVLLLDTAIPVETAAADARIRMVMPGVASAGTLFDVIGAGIARHAGNPTASQELLRWLAGERGQRILAAQIRVQAAITSDGDLRRVPGVRVDPVGPGVARLGALRQDAIDLAERAHYP
jgi:ABC-type Fe3+ transport system substrate-binding protein